MRNLRHIFGQTKGLDFFACIQTKKLVFINLRKGQIGDDAANLLGSVILRMILTAGLKRDPEGQNDNCEVIADEAQNFTKAGNATDAVLSETRKYSLAFTLATQAIGQLPQGAEDAIFANVSALIAMNVSGKDAAVLAPELRVSEPATLIELRAGEIYAKIKRPDIVLTRVHVQVPTWYASNDRKKKFPRYLPPKLGTEPGRNACYRYTEENYGEARAIVDRAISARTKAANKAGKERQHVRSHGAGPAARKAAGGRQAKGRRNTPQRTRRD